MICPKCKSEIDNTIKYCNYCGTKIIKNEHKDQYSYSEIYSNIMQKRVESEEDYLRAYIGNNYNMVKKETFSIATLFFGPLHLLYRKIYTPAILLICLLVFAYYYDPNIGFILNVLLNFLLAIKFNNLYLENSIKRIDEIKISNPDKSSTELLEICRRKGKPLVSVIAILLFLIIFICNILVILRESKNEVEIESQEGRIKDLFYQIPEGFQTGNHNTNTYKAYHLQKENNSCSIIIQVRENITLEKYSKLYLQEDSNQFPLKTINNWNWRETIKEESSHYLIDINQNIYHVTYYSFHNSPCKEKEEEFISSLDFQEIDQ